MRGTGRVFKRKNSNNWWISYCLRGKEYRESSGSSDRKLAERLLKQRLREIGADRLGLKRFVSPAVDRVRVEELIEDLVMDHRVRGKKSLPTTLAHLKAVRAAFDMDRAIDVNTSQIRRVVAMWQAEGTANGTINRRLGILKRAFALALEAGKLTTIPHFPSLEVSNAREGFCERWELAALLSCTPDEDLRDVIEWAFWTGMRKGEIASLPWTAFDRETYTLRLHARHTKTGHGRALVLEGPFRTIIERRLRKRRLDCPLIFHRAGAPVGDFRKVWASACRKAGLKGRLFHDLRRTAVRNLIRAGVPQSVAMAISGHRTASVFRRYDITSEEDLRAAAVKIQAYVEALPLTPIVTPLTKALMLGGK